MARTAKNPTETIRRAHAPLWTSTSLFVPTLGLYLSSVVRPLEVNEVVPDVILHSPVVFLLSCRVFLFVLFLLLLLLLLLLSSSLLLLLLLLPIFAVSSPSIY